MLLSMISRAPHTSQTSCWHYPYLTAVAQTASASTSSVSGGAAAGIAIGIILLALILLLLLLLRRRASQAVAKSTSASVLGATSPAQAHFWIPEENAVVCLEHLCHPSGINNIHRLFYLTTICISSHQHP